MPTDRPAPRPAARSRAAFGGAVLLALVACDGDPGGLSPSPLPEAPLAITLGATQSEVLVGDTVVVQLDVAPRDGLTGPMSRVGGLQGRLAWNHEQFEWIGQIPTHPGVAMVAPSDDSGAATILTVAPDGRLGAFVAVGFKALVAGPTSGFDFELDHLVAPDGAVLNADAPAGISIVAPTRSLDTLRPMGLEEWIDLLAPARNSEFVDAPSRIPGEGTVFGDVNLDLTVDVLDVLLLANASVGNEEIIVGTNSPSYDAVLAGNVRPANLPGLGGPGDPCPPGVDVCGAVERTLNVLDVLAVARESVGIDEAVIGDAIPHVSPIDTVVLEPAITTVRTLSGDTVYALSGESVVSDGGTLVIEAGTVITADEGAVLRVARTGSIDARGTALNPVVMTCRTTPAERGCWSGLVVQGNAPINRGDIGASGCREAVDDPREGAFGGCDPADDRGAIRYTRVEFATRGIELLGVGSGTLVDRVQVHGSAASGMVVAGGTAAIQRLLVTATGGNALRWRDGWTGRAQHLLLQIDPEGGYSALRGQNQAGNPGAAPESRPTLYNVTVVSIALGSTTGAAIELDEGSGLEVHNMHSLSTPIGLSIDGAESCALVGTGILVRSSLFAGSADLGDPDPDPGCVGSPSAEENHLLDAGGGNVIVNNSVEVAALLAGGLDPFLPDFRGSNDGVAGALSGTTPPGDGFFETASTYLGGAPIASPAMPNIPWYSGWTRGGVEIDAAFGTIQGSVVYASDGSPVADALVHAEDGDIGTATGPSGGFTLDFVRPGNTIVTVGALPSGCSASPAAVFVTAGATATVLPIEVDCAGYQIELEFLDGGTPSQEAAFAQAAARWSEVITGDVPAHDFSPSPFPAGACQVGQPAVLDEIDDVRMFVSIVPIDGAGGTLGQAGPCALRSGSHLPILGAMRFDEDDIQALEDLGLLSDVILHEMAHVLGYGTIWGPSFANVLRNPSLPSSQGADTHVVGPNAAAQFDVHGGGAYSGAKTPVENMAGPGSGDAHWRESVMANELMTPFIYGTPNPLSSITIGHLGDLGYEVDFDAADAYGGITLDGAPAPMRTIGPYIIDLRNDTREGPIVVVGATDAAGGSRR